MLSIQFCYIQSDPKNIIKFMNEGFQKNSPVKEQNKK